MAVHADLRLVEHDEEGIDLLGALEAVEFTVSGRSFAMRKGETIHTENSHKYTPDQVRLLLDAGDWTPTRLWSDPSGDFLLALAEATEQRSAP